jgi:cyanophycin synthetase
MNVIEIDGATVIIDYAHNVAAISALLDYASRVSAARRIAVLAVPGDRRDEDIRAVGALASALDVVVLKEHPNYRRGRAPGAIAALMRDGLLAAGADPARIIMALEEQDAVASVKSLMRAGDLVLFIADDGPAAMKAFETVDPQAHRGG